MNIKQLLEEASRRLRQAGIADYSLDSRLLLQFVTRKTPTQLLLAAETVPGPLVEQIYFDLVEQRCDRIPLHYITGHREFWSLDFLVSPSVLVPRPETEFLLDHVLSTFPFPEEDCRILDMCTGSGVIAVVLARELNCSVTAVDISLAALSIAGRNARQHACDHRVSLVASDFFCGLQPGPSFDLVVSNPPYIADTELPLLEPEVNRHEPLLALSGGEDGLACISQIADKAKDHLRPGGWLYMEIGADQGEKVRAMLAGQGYAQVAVVADWAGRDRVARAMWKG